mmetsp:Transcript_14593/g.37432  ORF Transcript_14593/g.37432 Transcript_14593/m.37432 type:complete len:282 (+) Transcript_14593:625-1470(+)
MDVAGYRPWVGVGLLHLADLHLGLVADDHLRQQSVWNGYRHAAVVPDHCAQRVDALHHAHRKHGAIAVLQLNPVAHKERHRQQQVHAAHQRGDQRLRADAQSDARDASHREQRAHVHPQLPQGCCHANTQQQRGACLVQRAHNLLRKPRPALLARYLRLKRHVDQFVLPRDGEPQASDQRQQSEAGVEEAVALAEAAQRSHNRMAKPPAEQGGLGLHGVLQQVRHLPCAEEVRSHRQDARRHFPQRHQQRGPASDHHVGALPHQVLPAAVQLVLVLLRARV